MSEKQRFRGLLSRIADHEDLEYYKNVYGVAVDILVGVNVTCFFWKTGLDVESDGISVEFDNDTVEIKDIRGLDNG